MNGSKKHRRLWKVPFAWTRVMGKVNGKGTMLPDRGFLGKEVDIFLDVWRWKWNTSTQRRFLWWFLEVSGTIYSYSCNDETYTHIFRFPFSRITVKDENKSGRTKKKGCVVEATTAHVTHPIYRPSTSQEIQIYPTPSTNCPHALSLKRYAYAIAGSLSSSKAPSTTFCTRA